MSVKDNLQRADEETRHAWDSNAAFWDEKVGEGNDFVNILLWPAILRLMDPQPTQTAALFSILNSLFSPLFPCPPSPTS
jgi:hypothetical protein